VMTPLLRICRDSSLTVGAGPVYTLVPIGTGCCSGSRHHHAAQPEDGQLRTIGSDLRLRGRPMRWTMSVTVRRLPHGVMASSWG
jgi:hypothetical protein